ncbi:DsbA family protein [Streptomyces mayteni]
MSQRNRDGKQSARERIRRARERERTSERRVRGAKMAGVSLVILAAAAGVGIVAANNGDSSSDATNAEPITVGPSDAPATLTVYEDFRCPACGQFEDNFRTTINELTDAGKLRVEYHLVSIIDGNVGGEGSKRAANAAACARDEDRFPQYHDVLFENQPAEQDDAFADTSHLINLAKDVEGLDSDAFRSCVQDGTHDGWVSDSNAAFLNSKYNATPTILLNGESVYGDSANPLTPDSLRDRVNDLADA